MIIDSHVHLFESREALPRSWLDGFKIKMTADSGEQVYRQWEADLDGSYETLIKDMDAAGVDKSVVFAASPSPLSGEEIPILDIWKCNEYVAEAQSRHPDRIIGFVRIDPTRRDAFDLLVKGITKWGLKGVKIKVNIPLSDESMQTVMAKINEFEIPVVFHMGVEPTNSLARFGNPEDLENLVMRFPKIKVVAAHHARGYEELLTAIISVKPRRIYSDLAARQSECLQSPWQFVLKLRAHIDQIPHEILMGSDWPFLKNIPGLDHKQWFDTIRKLKIPDHVLQLGLGIRDFSAVEKDAILGGNAKVLLGI
jgi:predicted TIM-barrel fold metal-dependent hydrolase